MKSQIIKGERCPLSGMPPLQALQAAAAPAAAASSKYYMRASSQLRSPIQVFTTCSYEEQEALLHPCSARPALELVRASGRKTGVLSNFSLASLEPSLAAAGLIDLVDGICAAHVLGAAKPAAEAYHAIADALGCPPAACVMLDDEPACVEGARAAGMRAYLVDRSRAGHDLERGVVADCSALAELLD